MSRNQPTFSELRTEVRRYLDDPNAGVWSDGEVNRNLNRAILRVWLDTEWEIKEVTITGQTNQSWYKLPSDCLVPRTLNATSWNKEKMFPTDMIRMDKFDRAWETAGNSIPSRFIPFSYDRLIIWPPVNANAGNRNFTLEYVPIPATVSSDSSVTLGSSSAVPHLAISDLIPIKATALCWLRQSWQRYLEFEQMYSRQLEEVKIIFRNLSGARTTKLRPAGKFEKAHGYPKFKLRL